MLNSPRYRSISHSRMFDAVALLAAAFCVAVSAKADDIGYDALVARLSGQSVPTGAGIRAGQVEASTSTSNPLVYGPDQSAAEFTGKTFTAQSGVPVVSGHATTVAQTLYSNLGIAGGVTNIYLWEANNFINSTLRYGAGSANPPLVPPSTAMKIYNNSWIGAVSGTGTPNLIDLEILRRADFAMNRDDTLFLNGMNNGATSVTYPLMAGGYHGISVGRMDGDHSHGDVLGADGAGRMKPEIVAPGNATSWSTPVVGAVAMLLYETAATHPSVNLNPNADETAVIKASILAGAVHRTGWTNNPSPSGTARGVTLKPLDRTYGVDLVNIDRSHLILTGGETNGATTAAAATLAPRAGWDFELIPTAAVRYWRFRISQPIDELSILATWHRSQTTSIASPTVANIDLTLYRVASGGALEALEGEAGSVHYTSGNVASRSTVDNVEHIYVRGLAAGEYVIEAARSGTATLSTPFALAWIMPETPTSVPGDLNGDGVVDGFDLTIVLSNWGGSGSGDANNDGTVNGFDLTLVLSAWG